MELLIKYEIESKTNSLKSAAYGVLDAANSISLEMSEAYLNLRRNHALVEVANDNRVVHEEILEQIRERTESGFGSRSEYEQAGSRYALANANYMTRVNSYEDAMSQFETLYGELPEIAELEEGTTSIELPESLDEARDLALEQNPSLLAQSYELKSVMEQYNSTKQSYFPVIDVELKKSINENVNGIAGKNESLSGMVQLNWNLYNGGADQLARQKSVSALQQSNSAQQSEQRAINLALRLAWKKLKITKKQMKFLKQHVELSKSTVDSYVEEFKLGRRNLLDLLIANGEYNSAREAKVNGSFDVVISQYRIASSVGSLLSVFDLELEESLGIPDITKIDIDKDIAELD